MAKKILRQANKEIGNGPETFNISIASSQDGGRELQHEIEQAVQKALESAKLKAARPLPAKMTLEIRARLKVPFEGEIKLK